MMRTFFIAAAVIAGSAGMAMAQDAAKGDPVKGEVVFHKCMPCHNIGPGAANKVGPELDGLDGRHSGSVPNFSYSDANKNSGIVWNEDTFKKYIKDPRGVVPGTKMLFPGLTNQHEVDNVWAYVSQFDANGNIKK
jgi:cytochrome c